jgi:hypothetical protein
MLIKKSNKYQYDANKYQYEFESKMLQKQIINLQKQANIATLSEQERNDKQGELTDKLEQLSSLTSSYEILKQTSFIDHLTINLSLNMLNISNDVTFNKKIDGGLGLGYLITPNLQAGLFYDLTSVRQLQDKIMQKYADKQIPNDAGTFYNSLDVNDNSIFYNKLISSLSLKMIFSIGNRKSASGNE